MGERHEKDAAQLLAEALTLTELRVLGGAMAGQFPEVYEEYRPALIRKLMRAELVHEPRLRPSPGGGVS